MTNIRILALVAMLLLLGLSCGRTPITIDELDALDEVKQGVELRKQGLLQQAFEQLSEAISLNPELAIAYAERGFVHYLSDNNASAVEDVGRALKLNSQLPIAYNYRGLIFVSRGETDNAIIDFTRAIQLDPRLQEAYLNRSNLYMANGQLGLSIDDVTAAVTLSPESAELYLLRAQVYLRTETPTEAVPGLEQGLSLTDDEALTLTVKRYLSLLQ